jgi:tRNA pseudouridine13 synthase
LFVPKLEKSLGIEVYATSSPGIGGVIRQHVEDFVVNEVLVDGSKAEVNQLKRRIKHKALGSSLVKNRYLLCVLVKRNWDTFWALKKVANQLGIHTERIRIAGIKDAKAVTAQHITIEDVSSEEIQSIQIKDVEICPIGYFRNELSSYYLLGNSFHLTIRNVTHSKFKIRERVTKIIEELEVIGGIPNFFGHQRFGTIRSITHLVGKSIVQGDLERAAMLFLAKPSRHEHPESQQAREQLRKTGDFKQALKDFPRQLRYERLMLMHLAKKPEDFIGAFRRLPTMLRLLFPQAYQAYLFNKFLSKRIERRLPLNQVEVGEYAVNVEHSGLPMPKMWRMASTETVGQIDKAVQDGKMRVVIPLVGFRQHPSQGIQGEIERQILEEEGVSPESFEIKAMPEISLRGKLRTAMVPLNDFLLKEISEDQDNSSKRKAEVSFMLYRGSYATIVLREFMKPRNVVEAGF